MGMGWVSALWVLTWIQFGLAMKDASLVRSKGIGPADGASIEGESMIHQNLPPVREFDAVWVRVLRDVNTECKTCPFPNCPNKDWYGSSYQFSAKCWTVGAIIGKSNLWLRTDENCYVTESDTIPYWRKCGSIQIQVHRPETECIADTDDLRRCETVREAFTRQNANMASTAACRICPNDNCDVVGNYSPSGRATLTCQAQTVSNQCMTYCPKPDPLRLENYSNGANSGQRADWYRTINNCYIHASLVRGDFRTLASCGPVPSLKLDYRRTTKQPGQPSDGSFSTFSPSGSFDIPGRPTSAFPVSGWTLPNPTSAQTDSDVTFSISVVSFATPPKDSQGWPDLTRASNSSPSTTLSPSDDKLNPPIPPIDVPKLSTSHLTIPSTPTPPPNISNIVSARSSQSSWFVLPARPTQLSLAQPLTFLMPSAPLPSNLETWNTKISSSKIATLSSDVQQMRQPPNTLHLPPRPSHSQTMG